jgi:hypothetical protein
MTIWNYKSAVLSAICRAPIFFAANLTAGLDAAAAAFMTEFVFRLATAGFYGALTQAFRRVEPPVLGTLGAVALLPAIAHSLEFIVHWQRGTSELRTSIVASMAFTVLSTSFNLFAMRRGALIAGEGGAPLLSDLRRMPKLLISFLVLGRC